MAAIISDDTGSWGTVSEFRRGQLPGWWAPGPSLSPDPFAMARVPGLLGRVLHQSSTYLARR